MQLAADASGVVIEELTYQDPVVVEGAPPPSDATLALGQIESLSRITGGYFQIVDFLRRLEQEVPRALLVTGLTVEEGENGFPSLTASVRSTLYALITPPADPNAPPPGTGTQDAEGTEGAEGEDGEAAEGEDDSGNGGEGETQTSMREVRL